MKRYLKIITIILLLIASIFILTGCGEKVKEQENNEVNKTSADASKIKQFYSKYMENKQYTMELQSNSEGQQINVKTVVSGEKTYTEGEYAGKKMITILDKDYSYSLDVENKQCTKVTINNANASDTIGIEKVFEEGNDTGTTITTGKMNIDNIEYYYEEFLSSEGTERFLFDNDDLKYILLMENSEIKDSVKILNIEEKVDDNVFEIPSDYEIVEY